MFQAWIEKNGSKFNGVQGANFHIIDPKYEPKLMEVFKTTRENFEAKVISRKILMMAILNYQDSRSFERENMKIRDGKVEGIKILTTANTEHGFKITHMAGFLIPFKLKTFISYLLDGLPTDKFRDIITSRNTSGNPICLPLPPERVEFLKLSNEGFLTMIFTHFVNVKINKLRMTAEILGEELPIHWLDDKVCYVSFKKFYTHGDYIQQLQNTTLLAMETRPYVLIRGPVSMYELVNVADGLHIYMFGDVHVDGRSACPGKETSKQVFHEFVRDTLLANSDKVIDVFFEIDFRLLGDTTPILETNYLAKTVDYFKKCLRIDKTNCPFKNTRFHYVDVRRVQPFDTYMDKNWRTIDGFDLFNDLYPVDKDIEEFLRALKIRKQLNAIENVEHRNFIEFYWKDKIGENRKKFEDVRLEMIEFPTKENVKELDLRMTDLLSLYQDFYTVTRLFRSYSISKNGYSSVKAKHVIMFLGANHVGRINAFFSQFTIEHITTLNYFKTVEKSVSETKYQDYQCLKIRSELPLFKYD